MFLEEGHKIVKSEGSLSFFYAFLTFLPEFHRQVGEFVLQNRAQHVVTIKVHLSASFLRIGVSGTELGKEGKVFLVTKFVHWVAGFKKFD